MNQRLSTAGMNLSYCVETTAGTMPTSGFTIIPEVKSTPSTNPTPNSIDVTPLNETEFLQYIAGLKDVGGVLSFTANLTADLLTAWNTTLITAYTTGQSSNKDTWFCISHPKLTKAVLFKGEPIACGFNEASVNAALETTLYIAPGSAPKLETTPTFASV